ncbi:MAG: GNAT family N-acetyltransferase [Saprospiraceae bacterium]
MEKDTDPAIYLHRIVTDPRFRGQNMVAKIVTWAREYGKIQGKKYLRMDTWNENLRLKEYYLAAGFDYLGAVTPTDFSALPSHYAGISLALFEMVIE